MAGRYTKQQVRDRVLQMAAAGASQDEIDSYVQLVKPHISDLTPDSSEQASPPDTTGEDDLRDRSPLDRSAQPARPTGILDRAKDVVSRLRSYEDELRKLNEEHRATHPTLSDELSRVAADPERSLVTKGAAWAASLPAAMVEHPVESADMLSTMPIKSTATALRYGLQEKEKQGNTEAGPENFRFPTSPQRKRESVAERALSMMGAPEEVTDVQGKAAIAQDIALGVGPIAGRAAGAAVRGGAAPLSARAFAGRAVEHAIPGAAIGAAYTEENPEVGAVGGGILGALTGLASKERVRIKRQMEPERQLEPPGGRPTPPPAGPMRATVTSAPPEEVPAAEPESILETLRRAQEERAAGAQQPPQAARPAQAAPEAPRAAPTQRPKEAPKKIIYRTSPIDADGADFGHERPADANVGYDASRAQIASGADPETAHAILQEARMIPELDDVTRAEIEMLSRRHRPAIGNFPWAIAAAKNLGFDGFAPAHDNPDEPRPTTRVWNTRKLTPVDLPPKPEYGFTTAKGSTYRVEVDGRTTRNKAARAEHPGDEGAKPTSQRTLYVDDAALQQLSEFQAEGHKRALAPLGDGRWGLRYVEGPSAGKFEQRTVVTPHTEPAVGLYPVELWNGGLEVHFGSQITEVRGKEESATVRGDERRPGAVGRRAGRGVGGEAQRAAAGPRREGAGAGEGEAPDEESAGPEGPAAATVRDEQGRLRRNLRNVPSEAIADEIISLGDDIGNELGAAPQSISDENMHTFSDGRDWVGHKKSNVWAAGRVQARHKAIDRLTAELHRRGEDADAAIEAALERYYERQAKEDDNGGPPPPKDQEDIEAVDGWNTIWEREPGYDLAEKEEKPREFSSTQLDLPDDIAERVRAIGRNIPDEDLAEDGREDRPHVTVKYGLHDEEPDAVHKAIADHGPVELTLGKASVFANGEKDGHDVVKLDVDGKSLRALNAKVAKLPNGDTHPKYIPHITVAYVKAGLGQKYADMIGKALAGAKVTVNHLTFSSKNRQETRIPLSRGGVSEPAPSYRSKLPFAEKDFAAVKIGGRIFRGEYHVDAWQKVAEAGGIKLPDKVEAIRKHEGFILRNGAFVNRKMGQRIIEAHRPFPPLFSPRVGATTEDVLESTDDGVIAEREPRYDVGARTAEALDKEAKRLGGKGELDESDFLRLHNWMTRVEGYLRDPATPAESRAGFIAARDDLMPKYLELLDRQQRLEATIGKRMVSESGAGDYDEREEDADGNESGDAEDEGGRGGAAPSHGGEGGAARLARPGARDRSARGVPGGGSVRGGDSGARGAEVSGSDSPQSALDARELYRQEMARRGRVLPPERRSPPPQEPKKPSARKEREEPVEAEDDTPDAYAPGFLDPDEQRNRLRGTVAAHPDGRPIKLYYATTSPADDPRTNPERFDYNAPYLRRAALDQKPPDPAHFGWTYESARQAMLASGEWTEADLAAREKTLATPGKAYGPGNVQTRERLPAMKGLPALQHILETVAERQLRKPGLVNWHDEKWWQQFAGLVHPPAIFRSRFGIHVHPEERTLAGPHGDGYTVRNHPVYVNVRNPLRLPDGGAEPWTYSTLRAALIKSGRWTEQEIAKHERTMADAQRYRPATFGVAALEKLISKRPDGRAGVPRGYGFDAIVYRTASGKDAYVLLKSQQVEPVTKEWTAEEWDDPYSERGRPSWLMRERDLFGYDDEAESPKQESLFGEKEGTESARNLEQTERAARNELARLKEEQKAAKGIVEQSRIARRIADLEKLTRRNERVSLDEMRDRAVAAKRISADPYSVTCPYSFCAAPPGEPCVTGGRRTPRLEPHAVRRDLAIKEAKEAQRSAAEPPEDSGQGAMFERSPGYDVDAKLAELKKRVDAGEAPAIELMPGRNAEYLHRLDEYRELTDMSSWEWYQALPRKRQMHLELEFQLRTSEKSLGDQVLAALDPQTTFGQFIGYEFERYKADVFDNVMSPSYRIGEKEPGYDTRKKLRPYGGGPERFARVGEAEPEPWPFEEVKRISRGGAETEVTQIGNGAPKSTSTPRITWKGKFAGRSVVIRTQLRRADSNLSHFTTPSNARMGDGPKEGAPHFLDVEVLSGDLTPKEYAELARLAEAQDDRHPVVVRSHGAPLGTGYGPHGELGDMPHLKVAPATAGEPDLIVIPCGSEKQKGDKSYPASELYTGPYFKAALRYARSIAPDSKILVLSARHGLLRLHDRAKPYETTFAHRDAVTAGVLKSQAHELEIEKLKDVRVLGGKEYIKRMAALFPNARRVLPEGLGIGRQLSALKKLATEREGKHGTQLRFMEKRPGYDTQKPSVENFYSRLGRAIEAAPFEKGTADQWRAQLSKNVPKEEREWTKVDAYLDTEGPSITKDELRALFERNRIRLTESVAGEGSDGDEMHRGRLAVRAERLERAYDDASHYLAEVVRELLRTHGFRGEEFVLAANRVRDAHRLLQREGGDRLYRDRVLEIVGFDKPIDEGEMRTIENYARKASEAAVEREVVRGQMRDLGSEAKWEQYTERGGDNYREIKIQLARGPNGEPLTDEPDFESSHFDEPNIIVHARVKDRMLPDGEKVLFVEELQSDLHERGREEGYRGPLRPEDLNLYRREGGAVRVENHDGAGVVYPSSQVEGLTDREILAKAAREHAPQLGNRHGVPNFPFKRSEEWGKLALRRLLDEAVKGGYDRIGFTTGRQQARRFDLSQHVEWITWDYYKATALGERYQQIILNALPKGALDNQDGVREKIRPEDLANYIGKDLAKRVRDAIASGEHQGRFEGEGLRLGGHGIMGFYDDMVPKFAREIGKELGVKLEVDPVDMQIQRAIEDNEYLDLKPSLDELKAAIAKFAPTTRSKLEAKLRAQLEMWSSPAEAISQFFAGARPRDRAALAEALGHQVSELQPTIKITPELRRAVQEKGLRMMEPKGEYNPAQLSLIGADGQPVKASDLPKETDVAHADPAAHAAVLRVVQSVRAVGLPESGERRRQIEAATKAGMIDPRGRIIRTPEDAANLMSAFRNPTMEVMHAFILDYKGKVVDHVAHTSGHLSSSVVPSGWGQYLAERATARGGVRVVLAHNHPSGHVDASEDDIATTGGVVHELHAGGVRFEGHVIIDHDEATWLTMAKAGSGKLLEGQTVKVTKPAPASWSTSKQLGTPDIRSPRDIVNHARAIADKHALTVVHLDTHHSIIAVEPRPIADAGDLSWLLDSQESHAARTAILVVSDDNAAKLAKIVSDAKRSGLEWAGPIMDIIGVEERQDGTTQGFSYAQIGELKGELSGTGILREYAIPLEAPGGPAGEQVRAYDEERRRRRLAAEAGPGRQADRVREVHGVEELEKRAGRVSESKPRHRYEEAYDAAQRGDLEKLREMGIEVREPGDHTGLFKKYGIPNAVPLPGHFGFGNKFTAGSLYVDDDIDGEPMVFVPERRRGVSEPPPEYGRGGERDEEEGVGSMADYREPNVETPRPTGFDNAPSRVRPRVIRHAILSLFNPELLGRTSKGTAGTVRAETAAAFRELAIAEEALRELGRRVGKMSRKDAVRFWDLAERGMPTGDPFLDEGNKTLRRVTELRTKQLIAFDKLAAEAAMENYLGRYWTVPDGRSVMDFLRVILGKRPFEGPKSFLKQRSWEYFVDGLKAIRAAKLRLEGDSYPADDRGAAERERDRWLSKVRPVTYNYVDSQLAKLAEMDRLIAAEKIKRQEAAAGRAAKVLTGKEEPRTLDGRSWVPIDPSGRDPAFNVYGPREGMVSLPDEAKEAGIKPEDVHVFGSRVIGRWYAHPDAAAVWHAHLSQGVRSHALWGPLFQAYMAPSNASVQIILGFSGFHFMNIAREGINSRLALGLDDLVNRGGSKRRGVSHLLRAPAAAAQDARFGRRIMQQFRNPGAHPELERVLRVMVEGGFRGQAASEFWTGDRIKALKKAWHEAFDAESTPVERVKGIAKLGPDALWAVIETQMKPLMEFYVPWMKAAATYRAVAQALENLPPGVAIERVRVLMGDIVKEMDYRYGHVVYDNHFMNRVIKDMAQAIFLAPGWTFGWLTLGGRAIGDMARLPGKLRERLRGDERAGEDMLGKSAAVIGAGLVFYMLINGVLTYFNTGEEPQGKDWFSYRDGTKDRNGNWNRHVLPGAEMRDFYAWGTAPVKTAAHKLKPGLSFIYRWLTNRTYFGDLIYDPEAPFSEKAKQVAKEAAKELATPISVQNYREGTKRGGAAGTSEAMRTSLGISPSKREFQRTPAQNLMYEYLARDPGAARTPDEAEAAEERARTRAELRDARVAGDKGKTDSIIQQLRGARVTGALSRQQMQGAIRGSRVSPMESNFKSLSYDQAVRVYEKGEPWEQAIWYRLLRRKAIATGHMRDFRERNLTRPAGAVNE